MKKQFISLAFCPPNGEYAGKYPNRLTDEVFQTLKDLGVTRLLSYGWDAREETIKKTKEMCAKYDIGYLIRVEETASKYSRMTQGEPLWKDLSQTEKEDLDARFVRQIEEVFSYNPDGAVKGIIFEDENGFLTFEAHAHAKEVFDEHFKGYEFYSNFLSYSINDDMFWGSFKGFDNPAVKIEPPFPLTGDMEIKFKNRFTYYDRLVEELLGRVHLDVLSWDAYPFMDTWKTQPSSVHQALFDLTAFYSQKAKKYGSQFVNYMQVGNWEPGSEREQTFAEMALQMNVTMAYGGSGFGWFPAIFPIDYAGMGDKIVYGGCGFVDLAGKRTKFADMVQTVMQSYQPFLEDLLASECLGVTAYGEYDNGFTKEDIKDLPDSECIFVGELAPMRQYKDERIKAECSNEIIVGTFENAGKRRYYVVNVSTVYGNEVHLTLPKGKYVVYEMDGNAETKENIDLILGAGCAAYIQEK